MSNNHYKKLPYNIKKNAENIFKEMKQCNFLCDKKPIIEDAITISLYNDHKENSILNSVINIKKKNKNIDINNFSINNDYIIMSNIEYCKERVSNRYNYCYNFNKLQSDLIFNNEEYSLSQINICDKIKYNYKDNNFDMELHIIYQNNLNDDSLFIISIPLKSDENIFGNKQINILVTNILCKALNMDIEKNKFDMGVITNKLYNSNDLYFYTFKNNIYFYVPDFFYINNNLFNIWKKNIDLKNDDRYNYCIYNPFIYNCNIFPIYSSSIIEEEKCSEI